MNNRPFRTRRWHGAVCAFALSLALPMWACTPEADHADSHATAGGHAHDTEDAHAGHHDDHRAPAIVLSEPALAANGVVVDTAAAGKIRTEIDLPGEIVLNADRVAHIVPRFPGVVQRVNKRLGDPVRAGDVLAVIQSNASVAAYDLTSMIDGTVIEKHLTLGEYVRDDADVFVVADLSTVWVNINVYARFLAGVHPGQAVRITSPGLDDVAHGTIDYVGPLVGESTRTGIARMVLPNRGGSWQPGLFVTAHIVVTESPSMVTVPDEAVQTVDGAPVVFVRDGAGFVPRTVVLGQRGGGMIGVTFGLAPGEVYVARGSFIFKAELGKSQAEHSH
ncbi:MAG TPA: efflux RND transporter periplasmic adaptor subunit [Candidatus Krumholzibacteria bacterium]|nr:efflux RND transporter periplasmic adaptor subunit [Candidatus Krumholzibacteria bacterium]